MRLDQKTVVGQMDQGYLCRNGRKLLASSLFREFKVGLLKFGSLSQEITVNCLKITLILLAFVIMFFYCSVLALAKRFYFSA